MKHPLPAEFSDKITVAVAGCGGNGSQFLHGLARMHLALNALGHPGFELDAFDPDTITPANIGRQLFSPADVGQSKAHVIINRLNHYYGLNWTAHHAYLDRQVDNATVSAPDILVGCVDSIRARQQLAKMRTCRYWLDMGNTDKKGQVIFGELEAEWETNQDAEAKLKSRGTITGKELAKTKLPPPARLPHILDVFPTLKRQRVKEDDAPSCSLAEALQRQDLFINQTVATFALQLLWQFIRQGGLDIHGYFINLETGRVTPLPIK